MEQRLEEIFRKQSAPGLEHLSSLLVKNVRFYRSGRRISVDLHAPEPMLFQDYLSLRDWLTEACGCPVDISVSCDNEHISLGELQRYVDFLLDEDPELAPLRAGSLRYAEADQTLSFMFADEQQKEGASAFSLDIQNYFHRIGIPSMHLRFELHEVESYKVDTVVRREEPKSAPAPEVKKKRYIPPKRKDWPLVNLCDVLDQTDDIRISGRYHYKSRQEDPYAFGV